MQAQTSLTQTARESYQYMTFAPYSKYFTQSTSPTLSSDVTETLILEYSDPYLNKPLLSRQKIACTRE